MQCTGADRRYGPPECVQTAVSLPRTNGACQSLAQPPPRAALSTRHSALFTFPGLLYGADSSSPPPILTLPTSSFTSVIPFTFLGCSLGLHPAILLSPLALASWSFKGSAQRHLLLEALPASAAPGQVREQSCGSPVGAPLLSEPLRCSEQQGPRTATWPLCPRWECALCILNVDHLKNKQLYLWGILQVAKCFYIHTEACNCHQNACSFGAPIAW